MKMQEMKDSVRAKKKNDESTKSGNSRCRKGWQKFIIGPIFESKRPSAKEIRLQLLKRRIYCKWENNSLSR